MPDKTIFRQKAIQAYRRNTEKDVLPHLISWPVIICLWLLLVVLVVGGFFACYAQVPTYVGGTGIILAHGDTLQPAYDGTVAVVFLSPDQAAAIKTGLPVDIQVGTEDKHVQSTIAQIEPEIISPDTARQRYQLEGASTLLITQPSRVAIIKLGATVPATAYAGSAITASIETGTQRLLTLLLGSGQFLGSSS